MSAGRPIRIDRPLDRVRAGLYRTYDGKFTFARHESDPEPKRWFVYAGDDEDPINDGSGVTTLRDAIGWVEKNGRVA